MPKSAAPSSLTYTAPSILPDPITDIPLAASTDRRRRGPGRGHGPERARQQRLAHLPNDAVLSLILTAPNGQSVTLAALGGLSGSGLSGTGFSDRPRRPSRPARHTATVEPSSPLAG